MRDIIEDNAREFPVWGSAREDCIGELGGRSKG